MAVDEGESILLRATYTDEAGERADPAQPVEVIVVPPSPQSANDGPFTATRTEKGVYEYEYDVEEAGRYEYRFETNDDAVEQGTFVALRDETQ